MDLTEFLTARLNEDEAAAKAAAIRGAPDWPNSDYENRTPELAHARRHDPARVLREVEAKRAIVTRCAAVRRSFDDRETGLWPDVSRRERSHAYATLCDLATIYSDHPDYRDEWKP